MPSEIRSFGDALRSAGVRPAEDAKRAEKKNYAERLSRHLSTLVANSLRASFPGIKPDAEGRGQESAARTAKGVKKLDVNYSTLELGLGLGVSIKTLNFRDAGSKRYTKNYTRIDNELRAEAMDYHRRQPYAVMCGLVFLPVDSVADGLTGDPTSSFGQAVRIFRYRSGRERAEHDPELFELILIGLYEYQDAEGSVSFFDVANAPPRNAMPRDMLSFEAGIQRIVEVYDRRNNPPFEWAE